MVFSSLIFLCAFLPITIFLYFIAYKFINIKASNIVLLILSLLFMLWGSGRDILVLFGIIIINYITGVLLVSRNNGKLLPQQQKRTPFQKSVLVVSLILSLGMLFYFKYIAFAAESAGSLLKLFGYTLEVPEFISNVVLPLGISFYTFQAMSYTLDVYFGKVEATYSIANFTLYVSLFPQIIAGPIVRYKDIYRQINERTVKMQDIYLGIERFMIGMVKKVLLANTVSVVADNVFALPAGELHFSIAWIGIIAYTLQIFLDFSAYSDMAIGLAKIFGFDLLENFNYPYTAISVQDFWRRWHISLSTWFRDYLYIPLGGNRKGNVRTYINSVIVFFLCGLWHGAAWVFIMWGLWHGLFLVIEKMFLGKVLKKIPKFIGYIYTMLVVIFGWVLFRSESLGYALSYAKKMVLPGSITGVEFTGILFRSPLEFLQNDFIIAAVFGILVSVGFFRWVRKKGMNSRRKSPFEVVYMVLLLGIFVISVASLYNGTYNPFIYFRF